MSERQITDHHDGHGLTESIKIGADGPGPGGASHVYTCWLDVSANEKNMLAHIRYQKGPRNVEGSISGVLDSCLLAIVADRMKSFQAGPFSCPENASVLEHVQNALKVLKDRADARAKRGVLGKNLK